MNDELHAHGSNTTLVFESVVLIGMLTMFTALASCAGLIARGEVSMDREQTSRTESDTRIRTGDGSPVRVYSYQAAEGTSWYAWAVAGLAFAGWVRAGLYARRGRLATTRIIDTIEHLEQQARERANARERQNMLYGLRAVKCSVKLKGRPPTRPGRWDATEQYIRRIVKRKRR